MFGKRNAARAEQAALLRSLGEKLDALTGEILALRADIEKDRVAPEGERDPDVLTEGERFNKWIMGEKGDGI